MEQRDDEGMGTADIKYGDSLVYVQHMKTGLWLSYQTYETKKRGVGRVEEKKVRILFNHQAHFRINHGPCNGLFTVVSIYDH